MLAHYLLLNIVIYVDKYNTLPGLVTLPLLFNASIKYNIPLLSFKRLLKTMNKNKINNCHIHMTQIKTKILLKILTK